MLISDSLRLIKAVKLYICIVLTQTAHEVEKRGEGKKATMIRTIANAIGGMQPLAIHNFAHSKQFEEVEKWVRDAKKDAGIN